MKNFSVSCSALFAIMLFVGCGKDAPVKVPDFSPLTTGSTWTYKNIQGSSYTLTATNRDTVAAGRTYKVLNISTGGNSYLGKNGNDYYRFGSFSVPGLSGVEELYLKDNQPVNAIWSTSQSVTVPNVPFPLTANLGYSIKSKGESKTVNGKQYANVIYVRLDITVIGFGTIGGGDFYYAEGVGLIEGRILITIPGQAPITESQTLISHSIK